MGKRRKKSVGQSHEPLHDADLRKQISTHMAEGKFRKARDAAKILYKRDAESGRPLLVEANRLLAEEMMAAGRAADARTVIEYLRTIATPAELTGLERRQSRAGGEWAVVAADAIAELEQEEGSERDRQTRADEAVASFSPLGEGPLAVQARAVQAALRAVCDTRWDDARASLREIPRRSPFAHWVVYVKGLIAFHCGATNRARDLFATLPMGSVPDRAAEAWRRLLATDDERQRSGMDEPVEVWCRMAGMPTLARPLEDADRLWRAGKISAAYDTLKRVGDFPRLDSSLCGQLTEAFFSAAFCLPEKARDAWLNALDTRLMDKCRQSDLEIEQFLRVFFQYDGPNTPDAPLERDVSTYLLARGRRCGADPGFESMVRVWLGKIFAATEPQWGWHETPPRNIAGAVSNFEQAIQLTPDRVAPYLELCQILDTAKRKPERNRLLDRMSTLFPDDRETLLLAGIHAIERKVWRKAVGFLIRARAADPLDTGIPERMGEALCGQLQADFEKRKFAKARKLWEEELWPLARDGDSLWRGRWALLLRRALLEELHDSEAAGKPWLDRALDAAPGTGVLWFVRLLLHEEFTAGFKKKPRLPKTALSLPSDPDPSLANFSLMLFYWNRHDIEERIAIHPAGLARRFEPWLESFLTRALKRPFTRADVLRAFEITIGSRAFPSLAGHMAKTLFKQDRKDPLYGLFKYRADRETRFKFANPSDLPQLDRLAAEARRRGDREALSLIDKQRQALQRTMPPPADFEPCDKDDDWDDLPSEFDEEGPLRQLATFIQILAEAPDETLEDFRRARPKDMPKEVAEVIINAAKSARKAGGMDGATRLPPPSPKFKPLDDPTQMDLF
jgi:tetratricopeptide (TPR) repeat protein